MDIEAHANDPALVRSHVRNWLNANRDGGPLLPGAAAIASDYETYLTIAPDTIRDLRLDPHEQLTHGDFLHVVERAFPIIGRIRTKPRRS